MDIQKDLNSNSLDVPVAYSEQYKMYVFRFWYSTDKRGSIYIKENLPITVDWVTGKEVNTKTINGWIQGDFETYAEFLDSQVIKKIDSQLIEERVEMLNRHAQYAKDLIEKSWEYIEENGLENSRNAVNAIIQGIKVERESSGLPVRELLDVQNKSDSELIESLRDVVKSLRDNDDENELFLDLETEDEND